MPGQPFAAGQQAESVATPNARRPQTIMAVDLDGNSVAINNAYLAY